MGATERGLSTSLCADADIVPVLPGVECSEGRLVGGGFSPYQRCFGRLVHLGCLEEERERLEDTEEILDMSD